MTFEKSIKSFAKINIGLSIPFKYSDNYHHLVSLFQPIDLYDEIYIKAFFSEKDNFALTWENQLPAFFPFDKSVFTVNIDKNLLFKAFKWMKGFLEKNNHKLPPLDLTIHINKKIPSPGGLGGGSSNAASLLLLLMEIIKPQVPDEEFRKLFKKLQIESLEIGADVPFFLDPKTMLISGIGEKYRDLQQLHLTGILAIPSFGFSTREMFSSLDKPSVTQPSFLGKNMPVQRSKKTLQHDNLSAINLQDLYNDYENLYKGLNNTGSPVNLNDQFDKTGRLVIRENNRTFFVKNDFSQVIENLYPEKYLILEKIRKAACKELLNVTGSENYPVITSMTGSGSTVYAAITTKENSDYKMDIDSRIMRLRQTYPDIIWLRFCSLK